jgi:hypothetical protein
MRERRRGTFLIREAVKWKTYVGRRYRSGNLTLCVPHEALSFRFNLNIGGDISVVN